MKTRILSLVLVLSMVLTLFAGLSLTVSADEAIFVKYTGEIVEGDYLIVAEDAAMNDTTTNNRLGLTEVIVSGNKVVTSVAVVWHIAPSGEYWTIKAGDGYAVSTGEKNQLTTSTEVTDKALWTIENTDNGAVIQSKANLAAEVNSIIRRNGNNGFACYSATTGTAPVLYKLSDGTEPEEPHIEGIEYEKLTGNIIDGDYLIVSGGVAMNTTEEGNRLMFDSVTDYGDTVVVPEESNVTVWHIAASGEYWTIKADDNYVVSTGAKSQLTTSTEVTDKALWTIENTDNGAVIQSKANLAAGVNSIIRKNGNYGFACYAASTGTAPVLYRLNTVNKAELLAKISEIQEAALAESDYTQESWTALQNSLSQALAVSSDNDATQEEVDQALANLISAFNGLVALHNYKDVYIINNIGFDPEAMYVYLWKDGNNNSWPGKKLTEMDSFVPGECTAHTNNGDKAYYKITIDLNQYVDMKLNWGEGNEETETLDLVNDHPVYYVNYSDKNDKTAGPNGTISTSTSVDVYLTANHVMTATCTQDGVEYYYGLIDQNNHSEEIPVAALGHIWPETWEHVEGTRTHMHRCERDSSHTQTYDCEYENGVCKWCGSEEPAKSTVTFMVNGKVLKTVDGYVGDELVLPESEVSNVNDFHFVGWVDEEIKGTASSADALTSFVIPSEDTTLYALYVKGEDESIPGYKLTNELPVIGEKVIFAAKVGEAYYALGTTVSESINGSLLTLNNGVVANGESYAWNVVDYDGAKALEFEGKYLKLNSAKFGYAGWGNTAPLAFIPESDGFTISGAGTGNSNNQDRGVYLEGTTFKVTNDAENTNLAVFYAFKYQEATGTTIYATTIPAFTGASLTLNDSIDVNFYIGNLTDETYRDYVVSLTGPNTDYYAQYNKDYTIERVEKTVSGETVTVYRVSYPISMKDYQTKITAQIKTTGGVNVGEPLIYGVTDYIEKAPTIDQDVTDLCGKLKTLCQLVENQLNKGKDNPDVSLIEGINPEDYQPVTNTVDGKGVSYYASSLLMKNRITLRVYFKFDEELSGYTLKVDGEEKNISEALTQYGSSKYFYYDVTGLSATTLNEAHSFSITKKGDADAAVTVQYSALSYAYRTTVNEKPAENTEPSVLYKIGIALFNYSKEAHRYFD